MTSVILLACLIEKIICDFDAATPESYSLIKVHYHNFEIAMCDKIMVIASAGQVGTETSTAEPSSKIDLS
jgi:hypothetical protein